MNIFPAILEKKTNKTGKVNIKIRIIHKSKVRDIGTKYYLLSEFFKNGKVTDDYPNADYINIELQKIILGYQEKLLKIKYKELPIGRIVEILRVEQFTDADFTAYFRKVIAEKTKTNARTGELYQATFDKIKKFENRSQLLFEDLNAGWLRRFESNMKQSGLMKSTIAIYLRNIRTVYNDAIDNNEVSLSLYPFRRFKISAGSDEKTPLTLNQLRSLISLPLDLTYHQNARNVWLLSFCLIGANSSDMFNFTSKNISGDRLRYVRNKTGTKYNIRLEPEALSIIEKMKGQTALINLQDRFKSVKSFTTTTNPLLKKIGVQIGVPTLIMYDARHTWAALCKNLLGTDDNDISAALGHKIGGVTQVYIHRNQELIDKLNRDLLDLVFKVQPPKKKPGRKKKEAGAS